MLELISGYPGTVAQWTSSYNARQLQSLEELKEIADNSNAYRFVEFNDDLLRDVSDRQRVLSIRLVLLPASGKGSVAPRNG
jgi:hypothetical protein